MQFLHEILVKTELLFFNHQELNHFKKIKEKNKDNISTWQRVNIWIPISIIVLTLIFVGFNCHYNNERPFYSKDFYIALFNGSLPLTAINILVIGLFACINFDKHREKELGFNFENLRTKLIVYFIILIAFGWLLYGSQAAATPFDNHITIGVWEIIGSSFLLIASTWITKKIILLQPNFIENTGEIGIKNEKSIAELFNKDHLKLKTI